MGNSQGIQNHSAHGNIHLLLWHRSRGWGTKHFCGILIRGIIYLSLQIRQFLILRYAYRNPIGCIHHLRIILNLLVILRQSALDARHGRSTHLAHGGILKRCI